MTTDSPSAPTFHWTEAEKALLRRTLRVRVLEEDRLEVETTKRALFADIAWALSYIGTPVALSVLAGWMCVHGKSGCIEVTPAVFFFLPVISLFLMLGFLGPSSEPVSPISFFPATNWFVIHRSPQKVLGKLVPPDQGALPSWGGPIHLATDIDEVLLRVALWASPRDLRGVRRLILERCLPAANEGEPPRSVADLVGREVACLPRAFYVPLARHAKLISVTPDTLVLRNGAGPALPWAILVVEFLIGAAAIGLSPLNILPKVAPLACPSGQLWYVPVASVIFMTAVIQTVLLCGYARRFSLRAVTLNKQASYLLYKDHLGESQIPTSECLLLTERNDWEESETDPAPATLALYHQRKRLVKWVLNDSQRSRELAAALGQGLREYLRAGRQRNLAGRGEEL